MKTKLIQAEQHLQSYKQDLVETYNQDKTSAIGEFESLGIHLRFLGRYLAVNYLEMWLWVISPLYR